MADTRRIFVILDPTMMNQPSLITGETIAKDYYGLQLARPRP